MITEIVTFWGTVQGVGFRPTLSRIAAKYRMKGQVRNMGAFVQLIVTDSPERIDEFIDAVRAGKPRMSDIFRIDREVIDTVMFDDFRIVSSSAAADEIAAVPADIAVCDECLAEFRDQSNPRNMHPFISCTNCGPRYTIMGRLPYDRDTTTMDEFPMCEFCEGEYTNPASRRYHAQTVSCHSCGPQAIWVGCVVCEDEVSEPWGGSVPPQNTETSICSIEEAIDTLKNGGVIAFKGVGGYYFVCSPFNEGAVRRLRDIKVREHKPFAVMFASLDDMRVYCEVNADEAELLVSPKRPIVLLEGKKSAVPCRERDTASTEQNRTRGNEIPYTQNDNFASGVLSTSRFVGAFLPSMALQYILLDALGPLIMTSANISDLPIIRDDSEMIAVAESDERIVGVLYNERRIVRRLDDSVTRVIDGTAQLIRRSKGWTPVPIYVRGTDRLTKDDQILALGGHLKSAFALTKGSFVYMSQYIGDIDNIETEQVFKENLASMTEFFSITPQIITHDMHPLYWTTGFAEEYAAGQKTKGDGSCVLADSGIALLPVQHHHAHIASVMAEHGLSGPVVGVAFDGTGYGTDGTIWGGEILVCEGAGFERYSHLRTIEMIGGDSSMRDGRKSAVSKLNDYQESDFKRRMNRPLLSSLLSLAPAGQKGTVHASLAPMGSPSRSFDIDITDIIEYSAKHDTLGGYAGERAAIESAIAQGVNTVTTSSIGRLFDAVASLLGIHHVNRYEGECAIMLENAAWRALQGTDTNEANILALRFHHAVANTILEQCRAVRGEKGITDICLSGGVFQNKILMEETLRLLREDGLSPYYNKAAPPNDGGIALGQAYIAMQHRIDEGVRAIDA